MNEYKIARFINNTIGGMKYYPTSTKERLYAVFCEKYCPVDKIIFDNVFSKISQALNK